MGTPDKETKSPNGVPHCPVAEDWRNAKRIAEVYMDRIEKKLGELVTAVSSQNVQLIGPATGKRQIPLEVVMALLLMWGVVNIITLAKDSKKDIKLNWRDGLVITDKGENK